MQALGLHVGVRAVYNDTGIRLAYAWTADIFSHSVNGIEPLNHMAGEITEGWGCTACDFETSERKGVWDHWSKEHTDRLQTPKNGQVAETQISKIITGSRNRYLKVKAARLSHTSGPGPAYVDRPGPGTTQQQQDCSSPRRGRSGADRDDYNTPARGHGEKRVPV
jgi:hypothetical protein